MTEFRRFFPITKIDAEQRMVFGYASTEARDDQGEVVTLPALQAALGDYMKFANIREMHQNSAVGIAKEAQIDDRGLYVGAKVVDDPAWNKVREGVYKGFSIGGSVTERAPGDFRTITGLRLKEISLVDRPANPEAVFDCWKAAGVDTARPRPDDGTDTAMAEALRRAAAEKSAGPVQRWLASDNSVHLTKAAALARESEIAKAAEETVADPAPAAAVPPPAVLPAETAATPLLDGIASLAAALTLAKGGNDPGDGSKPYGSVEYADPGYQSDKKKRYPIDTEKHVRAAWAYINKPKNQKPYTAEQVASIKAKIRAAGKKFDIAFEDDGKKAIEAILRKSLYDTGRVACIIQELHWLANDWAHERVIEGDDSTLPEQMEAAIRVLVALLIAQVKEETDEIVNDNAGDDQAAAIGLAAAAGGIAKALALTEPQTDALKATIAALEKAASKHSAEDQARLDLAHHALDMAAATPDLAKTDMDHLDGARAELRAAGAMSSAIHQGTVNSEAGVKPGGNLAAPNVTPPAPQYVPGVNSAVNTANAAALPVPAVNPDASGSGSHIAIVKATLVLESVAKRHGGHLALVGIAHDQLAKVAGAAVCGMGKAADAHSAEMMAHLVAAHEHLTKLGAICVPNPAPAPGEEERQGTETDTAKLAAADLAKGDIGALIKRLSGQAEEAAAVITEMKKRIETLEAQPLPPLTIARPEALPPGVRVVEKGGAAAAPSDEEIAARARTMTPDELVRLGIMASHRAPLTAY